MPSKHLDQVNAIFAGITAGDVDRATEYIDPIRFVQHNPEAADGVAGLKHFIRNATKDQLHIDVVRALEDGPYVVTHAKGRRSGKEIFFDVFRFDNDLVVEHWAFSNADAPPNGSGHSQVDGPTQPTHLEDTESNKALVRAYYEAFHLAGDHRAGTQYFNGDLMIRHEPGVRDSVTAFLADVDVLMQHRTIERIHLLLGEGDLVFIVASGTHEGRPCAYIDLYRVDNRTIVEHWGFPQNIPTLEQSRNTNGML